MSDAKEIEAAAASLVTSTRRLIGVAAVVFVCVIAAYVIKFGGPWASLPALEATLQSKEKAATNASPVERAASGTLEERRSTQAVWGQLGDYVGGVLNPMLSFLTLYLLIKTLQLQQVQIKQSQSTIAATNASNEITILGAALQVASEDLQQMQFARVGVTQEMYERAYKKKVWLAQEILKRADLLGDVKS